MQMIERVEASSLGGLENLGDPSRTSATVKHRKVMGNHRTMKELFCLFHK